MPVTGNCIMKILFIISILSALFITTSTAPIFGITQVVTASFIPIVLYILISISRKPNVYLRQHYNLPAYRILIFGVILLLLKYSIGQDYFKNILQFIFIPLFISIVFERLSSSQRMILNKSVLLFYIIECALAIYERIFQINLFRNSEELDQISTYIPEAWTFRSTSLMGHPLANAMVVTTILAFILLNKRFNIKLKLLLFALGYIALFCFNARGATIIATLFIIPYIIYLIRQTKNKYLKRGLYIVFILGGLIFVYYAINTSFGGRLFNQEKLLDGSAQTRLDVFQFRQFITLDQLLWGSPDLYLFLTRKLEAGGVENGIIVLIIDYGLIPVLFLLPLLIYFHYTKLSIYTKYERIWIMAIFYIIGTMNPNLSSPTQWTIWIFAYYAFRNRNLKRFNIYANRNSNKHR